ncbi:MAG TPA: glycosyltransferase family 4 protein, partial [Rhodocyclaceae bacterium]|nr:glycosyltransferase family 4 protein [Rhodocyclaceae bacterium]
RMRRNLVDGCGFPSERVVSIPTGIDFDHLVPQRSSATVRTELGLGVDDFVVLMVGVIRAVKRHEVALAAFAQLATELPSSRLVIAGDGPMRAWVEARAHALGIAGKTRFLGERDDVGELIGAGDVLLLSSRSEGVPQAVTQALGLGRPVVATRVGGVPELVEDGVSGKLVEPEDVAGMARALATLAGDAALRRRMGEAGREHVRADYSLATMLDRTEALYLRLLGARRTS